MKTNLSPPKKQLPVLLRLLSLATNLLATDQTNSTPSSVPALPNDPLFEKQETVFRKLNVFEAWRVTQGGSNVLVGIVDNGFDFFHPDLKGNLLPGYYAPDAYHSEVFECMAHGTFVASLIVAKSGNAIGMSGLAPGCRAIAAAHGSIENELLRIKSFDWARANWLFDEGTGVFRQQDLALRATRLWCPQQILP